MLLRPYQQRLVDRAERALHERGNTLAVAATGAGKTIMLSEVGRRLGGRAVVIQHRQELVDQNMAKFRRVNPDRRLGLFNADVKSWNADVTFAMQQTLANHLPTIPRLDLAIVDEAHHVAAPTYRAILAAILERNPDCRIFGCTATPERGDRRSLRAVFDNVCDQVTVRELVSLGFLVPPRAYALDVGGTQADLAKIDGPVFGEQAEVERILNKVAITEEIIRHWRERAGDRRTVIFCSTVRHAEDVTGAFQAAGVAAELVTGQTASGERSAILARLAQGRTQIVVNVAVLTEGFDCPPVSCVVLLRQCSEKGPMIQMIGRGLRTVNPEEFPGVRKRDCVILDFGTSLLTHGDIESGLDGALAEETDKTPTEAVTKVCPGTEDEAGDYLFPDSSGRTGCGAEIPAQCRECPLCGFKFEKPEEEDEQVTRVDLTELEILTASPFRWCDLFGTDRVLMASGFEAWAAVISPDGENWFALGKEKRGRIHVLAVTERIQAFAAADDFMRASETDSAARKSRQWLDDPATEKQLSMLQRFGYATGTDVLGSSMFTKYSAACHTNFQFARRGIEQAMGVLS